MSEEDINLLSRLLKPKSSALKKPCVLLTVEWAFQLSTCHLIKKRKGGGVLNKLSKWYIYLMLCVTLCLLLDPEVMHILTQRCAHRHD